MEINIEEVKVKFKILDQKKLKAIASLDFGDCIIKGFRIMDSDFPNMNGDKLWLTPPSYQGAEGKYHPIFFMENKDRWKKLEEKIWNEYKKKLKEHYEKQFDVEDDGYGNIPVIKS